MMYDFGGALHLLKNGHSLSRKGWNGKDMWIAMWWPNVMDVMTLPFIYMKTADDELVPWLCSQTDMLAEDWNISPSMTPMPGEISNSGMKTDHAA